MISAVKLLPIDSHALSTGFPSAHRRRMLFWGIDSLLIFFPSLLWGGIKGRGPLGGSALDVFLCAAHPHPGPPHKGEGERHIPTPPPGSASRSCNRVSLPIRPRGPCRWP